MIDKIFLKDNYIFPLFQMPVCEIKVSVLTLLHYHDVAADSQPHTQVCLRIITDYFVFNIN